MVGVDRILVRRNLGSSSKFRFTGFKNIWVLIDSPDGTAYCLRFAKGLGDGLFRSSLKESHPY